MTRIVLIRHGQTAWNKVERIRGQVDVPLDEVGLAQAEATAKRVANEWQPVAVYCSPLGRAVQTAQPIYEGRKLWNVKKHAAINYKVANLKIKSIKIKS